MTQPPNNPNDPYGNDPYGTPDSGATHGGGNTGAPGQDNSQQGGQNRTPRSHALRVPTQSVGTRRATLQFH